MRDTLTKALLGNRGIPAMRHCLILSVSTLLLCCGCHTEPEFVSSNDSDHEVVDFSPPSLDFEVHPSAGPHDGLLIELGAEEYHAELVYDQETVTIYVLDHSARKSFPIAESEIRLNLLDGSEPVQFRLQAFPQDEDGAGQASRFQVVDANLARLLEKSTARPRLSIRVAGKAYNGIIR